jgi:hypothetical protein
MMHNTTHNIAREIRTDKRKKTFGNAKQTCERIKNLRFMFPALHHRVV